MWLRWKGLDGHGLPGPPTEASCSRLLFSGHSFAACAQVFLAHQKLGFCAGPPLVPVLGNEEKFWENFHVSEKKAEGEKVRDLKRLERL